MDVFDEELLRFWKIAFNSDLQYIMIGGVATNLHGYQRTTEDIDMWVEDTKPNREILRKVFISYGLGDIEALIDMEFIAGWTYFHLDNGIRLDIMTSVKGLTKPFDYYHKLASIASIYDVDVPFLHINHLIDSKKSVNRPKDQSDIIALEKIKKLIDDDRQYD